MSNRKVKKDVKKVVEDNKDTDTINIHTYKGKNKKKKYFGYSVRIFGCTIVFLMFFLLTSYFLPKAVDFSSFRNVNYRENSDLDYRVYLRDNDFYDTDYLGKDKIYVANLIDKILIGFDYNFVIEEKSDVNFNYDIIAKLTIDDEVTKDNYFEKEYTLSDNNSESIKNDNKFRLKKEVSIDYNYYNSLANKFRQSYGVDTISNLTVYLKINKKNSDDSATSSDSSMFIKIPLSQKAVNIEMNYQEINNSSYLQKNEISVVKVVLYLLILMVCVIITLVSLIKLIKLLSLLKMRKSTYDKYINRILTTYDRLIVENSTGPDLEGSNIIKITKFEELLDTRDNLKLPIMYYNVSNHNKCYFYIKHDKDLYLMTVKAVDLEEENK